MYFIGTFEITLLEKKNESISIYVIMIWKEKPWSKA